MPTTQTLRAPLRCLFPRSQACFSSNARRGVNESPNPATTLLDAISPAKTSRPGGAATPSRKPSEASDSSNPSLFPFPSSMGNAPSGDIVSTLRQHVSPRYAENRVQERQYRMRIQQVEQQQSRMWRDGDVYAPHDLSPVEQQKARQARMGPRSSNRPPANTRKMGGKDVLDDLGINPVKEYKNFAMMSEFITEMGRIKHSRETGLRAVNQRKMAKAVRRAIGIGIMPSVHKHPELFEERMLKRGDRLSR